MKLSNLSRRTLLASAGVAAGAALLPACSTSGGDDPTKVDPDVAPLELATESSGHIYPEAYIGPKARDFKPFGDGSKTYRIVVPQDASGVGDWAKNDMTAYFEKATGVKVKFEAVLTTGADGSSDMTKINAMLASGDLPDAFMGISFSTAQIALYGQQGIFLKLDDLIKTYGPYTREMMTQYPDVRSLVAAGDGALYSMPTINDCFHCRSSPGRGWISQKYLDAVGMKAPTTTEEFREVMLEFKGKNPSGKSGFMPFGSANGNDLDRYFFGSFGYAPGAAGNSPGQVGDWMRLNGSTVEFAANTDQWREMLVYLNQLGKDGIITKSAFTMTGAELTQSGNKGQLGFVRAYWWGSFFDPIDLSPDAPWRDYIALPPLKGPGGSQIAQWDHYGYTQPGIVITKSAQNAAELVQWADTQLDLQAIMNSYAGVQDKNWSYAKEGSKGINGKQGLYSTKLWPAPAGQSWAQWGNMYRSSDFRLGEEVDPQRPTFEAGLYQAGKAYEAYAEPKEQQLPPLIIPDDKAAGQADMSVALRQHVQQSLAKFAVGEQDPSNASHWSAYLAKFDEIKLKELTDIYQASYDARPK